MSESKSRTILFYRNFQGFAGGHLKVWHYFNHVHASPTFTPKIYFTETSRWNETNPWSKSNNAIVKTWTPAAAGALFIGGADWLALPVAFRNAPPVPIINIVQGLSHADPADPRYAFLRHRALRICVNSKIEEALRAIPGVNGPIFHVPMGLDHATLPPAGRGEYDVVIAALKERELGKKLCAQLQHVARRVELLARPLPRRVYLQKIADSRVAVFLPRHKEGFYLPPLEAMAMRRVVVCPDCVGNRVYALPGWNCFQPAYDEQALARAVESALALSEGDTRAMTDNATRTATRYTLERERAAFLNILSHLDTLWNS